MSRELSNNEYKLVASLKVKKYRDSHKLYIIEGEHLVSEYIKSGKKGLMYVFFRYDFVNENLLEQLPDEKVFQIRRLLYDKLCDTKTPQGILAVVKQDDSENDISGNLIVALDNINDPGNLGTILRTCYWYGVDTVLIGKNSADVYNPKTIRSSQGALFHVNYKKDAGIDEELNKLNDYDVFLTSLNGTNIRSADIRNNKNVIVFGNEANGISENLLQNEKYKQIKIKSYTGCESLNVSVSAGIILNEFRNIL